MKWLPMKALLLIAAGVIVTALVLSAAPAQALFQPPIPHPTDGRDNCLACHEEGVGDAPQIPDNHAGRGNSSCQGCHQEAEEAGPPPPEIPHTLEGRENCLACHVAVDPNATPSEDSEEPAASPPPPTPVAYPEPQGDANGCLDCHQELEGRSAEAVNDWQVSIHADRDVICADCHGGDPNATNMADAHGEGFIGAPDRTEIPELCGSCHANVELMRQFDLPTDQLAKYRESLHGQRLAEGDEKVATCFDCHDGHATRETNDPSASVYRTNVPQLCGSCHADQEYMAEYEIPTHQYDLYRDSVHGEALLERQDTRAPNCADCHGTHGAAPPGFAEVSNVCGSCHSATQNYYLDGAHNSEDAESPRCVSCHGRYDVQQPSEAMFAGSEPRQCGSCHAPDSETGQVVSTLHQALTTADAALIEAEEAVERASSLGMLIAEEESLLTEARTRLITARAAQHTVDVEAVTAETEAAVAMSEQAREQAEAAIAENQFRRRAMVIALGVNALVIVSLVLVRRELVHRS